MVDDDPGAVNVIAGMVMGVPVCVNCGIDFMLADATLVNETGGQGYDEV
jgi:hypothetical protein